MIKLLESGMKYLMDKNTDLLTARSIVMLLMVFIQNIHVFNCRSEKQSAFKVSIKSNPFVVISVIMIILKKSFC